MSLKKMMKKQMKFVWKKKRLSEKGCFWAKMGENLRRNEVRIEVVVMEVQREKLEVEREFREEDAM